MKRPAFMLGIVCGCAAGNVMATTVTTTLFTIDVPNGMTIENDESGTLLAGGSRMRDGMPTPFLIVNYCTNSIVNSETSNHTLELSPCTKPCTEETLLWTKKHGETQSPVARRVTQSGIVELRAQIVEPSGETSFAAMSCSLQGQVYVALVSDESKDQTQKMFDAVFGSVAWMSSGEPAPDLVIERRRLTVREPLPFVRTRWGDGVIFPAAFGDGLLRPCSRESLGSGDAYWQPTEEDVKRAEEILSEYVSEHGLDAPEVHTSPDQPMPDSWPDLKHFQRQYVGVVRDNHKTIYASFAPAEEVRSDPDWRRRPFQMCDGGADYFGVETDLTSSAVLHIAFDTCMCHVVTEK